MPILSISHAHNEVHEYDIHVHTYTCMILYIKAQVYREKIEKKLKEGFVMNQLP